MCVHLLSSTGSRLLHVDPLRSGTLARPTSSLAICRVVTDLTLDVALPPVLDYTPPCDDAC